VSDQPCTLVGLPGTCRVRWRRDGVEFVFDDPRAAARVYRAYVRGRLAVEYRPREEAGHL